MTTTPSGVSTRWRSDILLAPLSRAAGTTSPLQHPLPHQTRRASIRLCCPAGAEGPRLRRKLRRGGDYRSPVDQVERFRSPCAP